MIMPIKEQVQTVLEQLEDQIPAKGKQIIGQAMIKMYEQELPLKEILGCSPEVIDAVYNQGYQYFQGGKYQEALSVFSFLEYVDDQNPFRCSFTIAACHHYMKNYFDAAAGYLLCSLIDSENPIPHFHLYDCLMKLNYPLAALNTLYTAITLAEHQPQYAQLRERAILEYHGLIHKVKNK